MKRSDLSAQEGDPDLRRSPSVAPIVSEAEWTGSSHLNRKEERMGTWLIEIQNKTLRIQGHLRDPEAIF